MKKFKTTAIWLALVIVFFGLFALKQWQRPAEHRDFETFLQHVQSGLVSAVRVHNNEITVQRTDGGSPYVTLGVLDDELTQRLSDHGVLVTWGEPPNHTRTLLVVIVPLLLVVAFLWYFVKKAGASNNTMLAIGRSRARMLKDPPDVRFSDVGGCEEAKELLRDVIDFLQNPQRWTAAGARLPRGVLLEGPPGCGKTLLARAVAGESGARFFVVSASEFVELFVGVGAARVRDMFDAATKNAPAVVFIDELDAVGRRRGSGIGAGHDEREQTLNQLLVCLDGFERQARVVVIGATNRSDILDSALLRPGRFDRRIRIPDLTAEARRQTLQIHVREKPIAQDVDLDQLVARTAGFTGAQLENVTNEAALLAVRRARRTNQTEVEITWDDFLAVMEPSDTGQLVFDKLDTVLIESVTQLAQPTGRAVARVTLDDHRTVQGEILWADASFIKLRRENDEVEIIVPKFQIEHIQPLSGTELAAELELAIDPWANRVPDLA